MANNAKHKLPIQVIFAIILAVATICAVVIAIMPTVLPVIIRRTPTAIQVPTSTLTTLSKQSITEITVVPSGTPNQAGASTMAPIDTPISTFAPTYTSTTQLLPDLTVTGISNPTCIKDRGSPQNLYIKLSIIVRNIGPVSTRSFGSFSVLVNLILGQHRYSLDEWASRFNGVLGRSNMDIVNLKPGGDIQLNLSLDLKGNTKFGVEVIANSGQNTIPESDTTNNTLIQGFSVTCT